MRSPEYWQQREEFTNHVILFAKLITGVPCALFVIVAIVAFLRLTIMPEEKGNGRLLLLSIIYAGIFFLGFLAFSTL